MTRVRDLEEGDETVWRRLWEGYNQFYEATVPSEVTAGTWQRLLSPDSGIFARLAEADRAVVGFAHAVLHPGTWSLAPCCYLEDLYVAPESRGRGVGEALIEDLIARGRRLGWGRLYWHTRAGNATARRLYDRFTVADDFVRYNLDLGE